MNILKLYYSQVLRLNDILPDSKETFKVADSNLRKLSISTFLCPRTKMNEAEFAICRRNEREFSNDFAKLLLELRKGFATGDGIFIFRTYKLNSLAWKTLHKCIGDLSFMHLMKNFDIFVDNQCLTQVVGYPLNQRSVRTDTCEKKAKKRKADAANCKGTIEIPAKRRNDFDTFPARKLLYSKDLRDSFVHNRFIVFGRQFTKNSSAEELAHIIFGSEALKEKSFLIDILTKFLVQFRRVSLRGLLDCYCPMIDAFAELPLKLLVQAFIAPVAIEKFVRVLLSKVVPIDLLGESNMNHFINCAVRRISDFRKFDQDNLRSFVDGFKLKNCLWLRQLSITEQSKRQLVSSLIRWFLRFVVYLVKKSFYVTESQFSRNRLLFYRKPMWIAIVKKASIDLITKCKLQKIALSQSRQLTEQKMHFGPFGFRFIPKLESIRPILANFDNQHRVEKMNYAIKPILAILQNVLIGNRSLIGSAESDFELIRKKYVAFISSQRKSCSSSTELQQPLYFVKADVNACFDSMLHSVLLDILEHDLKPKMAACYVVQNYCSISMRNGKPFRSYRFAAWPQIKGSERIERHLARTSNLKTKKNMILIVKNEVPELITRETVLETLKKLIANHVVKVLHKFYRQTQGIAQGSALSTIFCDMYLAKLEQRHLSTLVSPGNDFLLRHVDDFLYVTPSKPRSVEFVKKLLNGLPDFNISSSPQKVVTNFDDDSLDRWFLMKDGNVYGIPWCGLLFHPLTGEVTVDDNRWRIVDVRDLLSINYAVNVEKYVGEKLIRYLASRFPLIFFDDVVNSNEMVAHNVSEALEFLASCYNGFKFAFAKEGRWKNIATVNVARNVADKMMVILNKTCRIQGNSRFPKSKLVELFMSNVNS